MPIIGVTDQPARPPRIGTLRKGSPKTQNGMGKELDFFRLDSEDAELVTIYETVFGPAPKLVRAVLPFDTPAENWSAWWEKWDSAGLLIRCDGQTVVQERQGTGYSLAPRPCSCHQDGRPRDKDMKPVGRLDIIIPELGRYGVITLVTHSLNDIAQISRVIEDMHARALRIGLSLAGIPILVRRVQREISTPNAQTGKRTRRAKWLVEVTADPMWVATVFGQRTTLANPLRELPELMAPDEDEDIAEGDYIETEEESPSPEPLPREGILALFDQALPRHEKAYRPTTAEMTNIIACLDGTLGGRDKRLVFFADLLGRAVVHASDITTPEWATISYILGVKKDVHGPYLPSAVESKLAAYAIKRWASAPESAAEAEASLVDAEAATSEEMDAAAAAAHLAAAQAAHEELAALAAENDQSVYSGDVDE